MKKSTGTRYTETTRTRCPFCGYLLDFRGYRAGRPVTCYHPNCKKEFIVGNVNKEGD